MSGKHEKPFDYEAFEKFVLTWETSEMKESLDYRFPYPAFESISQRLKQLDDGVCRIVGYEKSSNKTCFCGKNSHTEDCLIWPHLILKVLDPDDKKISIHSLWMKPVTFKRITENTPTEESPKKFFVFLFSSEGFQIIEATEYGNENPNFLIVPESGQWLLGDDGYFFGTIVKTSEQSAMTVLGGDVDFLREYGFSYFKQMQDEWKEKTAERVLKAVMDD